MAEQTRLQKSRSKLSQAGGAVAIAAAAFFGGQSAAPVPDGYVASASELHEMMGRRLGTDEKVVGRINLAGEIEAVATDIPSERWTVAELDNYLERLSYFKRRVEVLREARVEYEAALADSIARSR